MVVSSPQEFAHAVAAYRFDDVALEPGPLAEAAASVAEAGLLVVGETHGIRETPGVLYALAAALGTRALALEWSHEEMEEPVQAFVRSGSFDFERLWSLPASAEFFCGDGRIAAGHFALLERLRAEGRLEQAIVYDRLDPEPPPAPEDWQPRDRELAERLLEQWDERLPLLVLTGSFHARLDAPDGTTAGMHLASARPGLRTAMLAFAGGRSRWRGRVLEVEAPPPGAPIELRLPEATPAVVPGPPA